MEKALIAIDLISLYIKKGDFLDRADIKVLTVASNDAFLKTHKQEKVDLIVTRLDMPGSMSSEKLIETIRNSEELRKVAIIVIGEDTPDNRERGKKCGANAILFKPVDSDLLHDKMCQLLNIAPRQSYREVLHIVDIEGKFGDRAFFGHGENISASGMLLKTEDIFAIGDQIYFTFFLPDRMRVRVRGIVVRRIKEPLATHLCQYGVQFMDIAPQYKSAIEMYTSKK